VSLKEYKSGTTFPGIIERTADKSEPAWPEPLRAKENAPNILFIVLDNTEFGQLGCYGQPYRNTQSGQFGCGWSCLQQYAYYCSVLS